MIWLLAACAAPPMWSDEAVLGGVRARLDRDADGRVTAAEYDAARWNGPPFASADTDGSGELSASELAELLVGQSPTAFDGTHAAPGRRGVAQALLTAEQRPVWEVLVWMGDTLRAQDLPGPDPAAVERAVATGSMTSPETRAVLAAMRVPWESRGWTWPFPHDTEGTPALTGPNVALVEADPNAAVEATIRARFEWGDAGPPGGTTPAE